MESYFGNNWHPTPNQRQISTLLASGFVRTPIELKYNHINLDLLETKLQTLQLHINLQHVFGPLLQFQCILVTVF